MRLLASAATREANVMAYNDVFVLIGSIAILTMIWICIRSTWLWHVKRQATLTDSTPGAPTR
jgi:hypothetical protein